MTLGLWNASQTFAMYTGSFFSVSVFIEPCAVCHLIVNAGMLPHCQSYVHKINMSIVE